MEHMGMIYVVYQMVRLRVATSLHISIPFHVKQCYTWNLVKNGSQNGFLSIAVTVFQSLGLGVLRRFLSAGLV